MGYLEKVVVTLGPWGWWVLGLVLAGVEVLAPGSFFIFFAVAAILVGTAALFLDLSWQVETVAFVALAVVAVLLGRRVYGRQGPETGDPLLNDRLARQVGRSAVLATAIVHGTGEIRLDDTLWRVEGPDLPAGLSVRITGHRNGRLVVEAAPEGRTVTVG